jgi:hypothetical protein
MASTFSAAAYGRVRITGPAPTSDQALYGTGWAAKPSTRPHGTMTSTTQVATVVSAISTDYTLLNETTGLVLSDFEQSVDGELKYIGTDTPRMFDTHLVVCGQSPSGSANCVFNLALNGVQIHNRFNVCGTLVPSLFELAGVGGVLELETNDVLTVLVRNNSNTNNVHVNAYTLTLSSGFTG